MAAGSERKAVQSGTRLPAHHRLAATVAGCFGSSASYAYSIDFGETMRANAGSYSEQQQWELVPLRLSGDHGYVAAPITFVTEHFSTPPDPDEFP